MLNRKSCPYTPIVERVRIFKIEMILLSVSHAILKSPCVDWEWWKLLVNVEVESVHGSTTGFIKLMTSLMSSFCFGIVRWYNVLSSTRYNTFKGSCCPVAPGRLWLIWGAADVLQTELKSRTLLAPPKVVLWFPVSASSCVTDVHTYWYVFVCSAVR